MKSFNYHYKKMDSALHTLLDETRKYSESVVEKIVAMEDIYLKENPHLYSSNEVEEIRYYLKASIYKFYLATLNLEQLWSLSHAKRDKIHFAIENSLDTLNCSDDEIFLISFVFEGFLFQGRAFLDFYMLYIALFLKSGHQGRMSRSKFFKALDNVPTRYLKKKEKVIDFFNVNVFSEERKNFLVPENWGLLLRSLRDKVAHRDRLRPSFDGEELLLDKVLFDWPTLQETTYDRFCQYMQNGMFDLIKDMSVLLYDLEWIPGKYSEDLWS